MWGKGKKKLLDGRRRRALPFVARLKVRVGWFVGILDEGGLGWVPLHLFDAVCVCARAQMWCQLAFRQQQFAERELKVGRDAK